MSVDSYRDGLRAYAEREFDILKAYSLDMLTRREFCEARAFTYLGFGYAEPAQRWWERSVR